MKAHAHMRPDDKRFYWCVDTYDARGKWMGTLHNLSKVDARTERERINSFYRKERKAKEKADSKC